MKPNPTRSADRCRTLTRCAVAALGLMAAVAHAQKSPYYIGASQAFGRESNLLRLVEGQATPPGYSKSDTYSTTSLLAGVDQMISRQRVFGNVALRATRYSDNSIYDNQGYTVNAGVDFATIERISGTVSFSANRALGSLNTSQIGLLNRKNLETTKTADAVVRVGLVTQYSFEVAAGHRTVDNSLDDPVVVSRDYNQSTLSAGVRWRPSSASNFGLALRGTRGEYPRARFIAGAFQADNFTRRDIDFTAGLQPSGASMLDARISLGKTEYDVSSRRDFSGVTGALNWIWQVTGKTRLTTRLARDTGQDSYAITVFNTPGISDDSRVTTTVQVKADYDLSAKVALTASLAYSDRDIVRSIDNPLIPLTATGRDKLTLFTVGARWAPTRSILVGCDIGAEKSDGSGALGTTLTANRYGCYGQITLQ